MAAFPTDPNEELPKNPNHLNESSDDSNTSESIQDSANKDISDNIDSNAESNEPIGSQSYNAAVNEEESAVVASETYNSEPEEIDNSEEFALASDISEESTTAATEAPLVNKRYLFEFEGRGNDYFFIAFRGYVLTVLTLGLYYPWARVQRSRYILNNLWLDGAPFVFEATGEEVFKGFIKVYAVLAALGGLYIYALVAQDFWLQTLMPAIFSIFGLVITPLAIHGSLRYRSSKTSWKGIYFNYSGRLGPLYGLYVKNILLTIFTLGIYGSWARVNLMTFIAENLRLGNVEFKYKGEGSKIFVRGFVTGLISYGVAMVLMVIVMFIIIANGNMVPGFGEPTESFGQVATIFVVVYSLLFLSIIIGMVNLKVWIMKYNLKSTLFRVGNHLGRIEEHIDIAALTRFELLNGLLTLVTLGVGVPFVTIRRMQRYTELISFKTAINFDNVIQTGKEYNDAFGEDLGDQFDIQLDLM